MRFKRTKSNCKVCPLRDRKPVNSVCGIDKPKIVFVGEAPGEQEDLQNEPFVGPAGSMMRGMAYRAGIVWEQTHRMNVINCRPPNNRIDSPEGQEALACCRPGFVEELEALKKLGVSIIGATGGTAAWSLGISGNITKIRGSVYEYNGLPVVPTFHPSYILRGNQHEETTWSSDFLKIKDLSLHRWKPPKENFNLFPTLDQLEALADDLVARKPLVAVDIEGFKKIMMIGFGLDAETAFIVPFIKKSIPIIIDDVVYIKPGGEPYWSAHEEPKARAAVDRILRYCPTLFQNAQFDVYALESQGFIVGNVAHDTMLLHHRIAAELPHRLEYIVSVYGKTSAWKDVVMKSDEVLWEQDDTQFRTYNARDCVVLHQVLPGLIADANELGVYAAYENLSLKLLRPLMAMRRKGINVDLKRLAKAKKRFSKDAGEADEAIRKLCELPEEFNLDSGDHMRLLIHGVTPSSAARVTADLAGYETNKKLRRDTKKYADLVARYNVFTKTKPLVSTMASVRKTDSGAEAVDDEAIIQIQRAANNRLEALEYLVRKQPKHVEEERGLRNLLKFVELWRAYQEAHKLLTTYSKFNVGEDGRIHPQYKIHGTATGRLSSADPNAQNLSGKVLDVFTAAPGFSIVKADYSNIELRVLAYLTGEPMLIEAFESGQNIHDVNTRLLFEIDKTHPQWDVARRAAKVYVFGRSYGGGVEGIFKQLITAVPELGLTLARFKEIDKKYFEKLDKYRQWCEKVKKEARETRVSQTVLGHKRIMLGTEDEIERQALNTPIQGSAGEIAELAIIGTYEELKKHAAWEAELICTVHDSILVECRTENAMEVAATMKRIMEREVIINGRSCTFPVDIEIGPSWGETEKVEVKLDAKPKRRRGAVG